MIAKFTAWTIIAGSLLFFAASFSPLSRVHMEASAEGKMAIITQDPTGWVFVQILYGLGAVLAAAGIGSAAYQLSRSRLAWWLPVSAAMAAGAVFFAVYVIFRAVNPQEWVQIIPPHPAFFTYTLLTQAGLFLFGLVLLSSPYPRWLAWLFGASMLALFVLTVIFRDMPPFAYYLISLPAGIVFLRKAAAGVRNAGEKQVSSQLS